MKNLVLGIAAMAFVASCTTTSSTTKTKSQPSIANTKWVLSEQVKGKTPTLNIEGNRVTGNAGCNNYFGELMLDTTAGNFVANNIGSTKMACENMATESNYLKMLSQANKYVVNGNVLELYRDNLLLVKFTKQ